MNALEISSAQELERFIPDTIVIYGTEYQVLTGYENKEHKCFWCGEELQGKLKRYCRGHMKLYYRHFEWPSARNWCLERYDYRCANCASRTRLEAHHIVPINGGVRFFSVFNLPWNLISLCHLCHQEIHAVMREAVRIIKVKPDPWIAAQERGQLLLPVM